MRLEMAIASAALLLACAKDPLPGHCQIDATAGYDSCASAAFKALAEDTGGVEAAASKPADVPQAILSAIDTATGAGGEPFDLLFVIDQTGSMYDDIYEIQNSLSTILAKIQAKGAAGTRVGLATYGDACINDTAWSTFLDLTTDMSAVTFRINGLIPSGGGDWPDSVYDGVKAAMDSATWSNPKRFSLVIGDAGPHYANEALDDASDTDGNSCLKVTYDEAVAATKAHGAIVKLYPILVGTSG